MAYKQKSPISVAEGGTGAITLTDHGVLLGSGTSAITPLGVMTNGQLVIGSTGADPVVASLGAGSGITITPGAGTLSIAATATGDVTASANLTDNAVVRGDGGAKGVQTSTMLISDAGEMTNPSQPAFLAYLASQVDNKTGNATSYTLGTDALTEVFDQNSDFNTNGTFTAPVTGRYFLVSNILYVDAATATSASIVITTSNRAYNADDGADTNVSGNGTIQITIFADMDAADTATTAIAVSGVGADTVDIFGNAALYTFYAGNLVC